MTFERYLDPCNDVAYKKIFGTEKSKDVLIHFLNDILEKNIKEVTFLNPILAPEIASEKQSIVDILCTDAKGVVFIVEMQVAKMRGFEKRAQYYAAKAYSNQIKKSDEYHELKEVIFLAIADFEMFPEKKSYKSDHVILDKQNYTHDLKDFSFTFLELPKFTKNKVEELSSYEEKWCYFFKHSDKPEDMEKMIANSDIVIKTAYNELLRFNWTNEELNAYDAATKQAMDQRARESQARYEGEIIGREKGKKEGRKEGRKEGVKVGIEKNKIETAQRMLSNNIDISTISLATGFTEEKILEIKRQVSQL